MKNIETTIYFRKIYAMYEVTKAVANILIFLNINI